jgi:4-oxalocrotonate tautomerase
MPEVYVHIVKGRSADQKKALAQDITTAVMKHMNAPADAVVVSIIETEAENKAKGRRDVQRAATLVQGI